MANVIIIERDNRLRNNWYRYLSNKPDFLSVEDFSSAKEILSEPILTKADILILDVESAHTEYGYEVISKIRQVSESINILLTSHSMEHSTVLDYIKLGCAGHVFKPCASRKIYECINAILRGGKPISPLIAKEIVEFYQEESFSPLLTLSEQEIAVLSLLSKGKSYSECAIVMNLSLDGLRYYIREIYHKLGACNKVEAISLAKGKFV